MATAYNPQVVAAYYTQQGLPAPSFEVEHIPGRKYRLDICFPDHKVGVECQGGIYKRMPSHSSASGIVRDMEKNNLGLLHGWRVLKLLPEQVMELDTVRMLATLLGIRLKNV